MRVLFRHVFLFLIRNWKSRELQLLAFALFMAVFSVTSIVLMTQGFQARLDDKSGNIMGSDRVIISPQPIDPAIAEKAAELGIRTSQTINFLTMLVHHTDLVLADVRAADEHYPLRGELRTASKLFAEDEPTKSVPAKGSIWIESRIFPLLNVKVGERVTIGEATFTVMRVLTNEPDRSLEGINLAPWVLMNQEDIPRTHIIQPGSRVTYKLYLAGSEPALDQFESWVKPKLLSTQSFVDARHARPLVNTAFERINHYVGLIFLVNVGFAGIAISMSVRRFCERQLNSVAIMRCFGATRMAIFSRYLWSLTFLGLGVGGLAVLCSSAIGYSVISLLYPNLVVDNTVISLGYPVIMALITVLVLLIGFIFPVLMNLMKVSPLRVLRRELHSNHFNRGVGIILQLLAILSLVLVQVRDTKVTLVLLSMSLAIALVVLTVIKAILKGIGKISHHYNLTTRLNLRNVASRAHENAYQVMAYSLVLALLGVLSLIRFDLLTTWKEEIAVDTPNYFVLNIPSSELGTFQTWLKNHEIEKAALYPMFVARLMAVNEDPVEMSGDEVPKKRTFPRLLNLTFTQELPLNNQIIQGEWFKTEGLESGISVEKGFADRLSIQLGDTLEFQISDKNIKTKVTSIRSVEWDSFQPNFYVIFPSRALGSLSTTYMTSFYLSPQKITLLKSLVDDFPMVNLISTEIILTQLAAFFKVVLATVELLWAFTLIISFVLLFATILSTLDARRQEAVLLRVLGVNNQRLRLILMSEFILLGFLAGVLAVFGANGVEYWLTQTVFNLPYHVNTALLFGLPLVGIILVGIGGWIGTNSIFLTPPNRFLAEE